MGRDLHHNTMIIPVIENVELSSAAVVMFLTSI